MASSRRKGGVAETPVAGDRFTTTSNRFGQPLLDAVTSRGRINGPM